MYCLRIGGRFGWHQLPDVGPRRPRLERFNRRTAAFSGGDAAVRGSYVERIAGNGWQAPLKAALTSGSLSAAGDLLAQVLGRKLAQDAGKAPPAFDALRTLRMFGFGLCWYGPCQYLWYNWLDWRMPLKTTPNFLTKVALNQLVLGPITLSAVFTWTLGLTGQAAGIPDKIRQDLVPSMVNGWKFWVPAASINFYAVPLQYQVLYMSCCGVLWTAYLSYASTNAVARPG